MVGYVIGGLIILVIDVLLILVAYSYVGTFEDEDEDMVDRS